MTTEGIDPRRIEELHLLCTAPREQVVYDGWLVRRARDDVKRARSVNAIAASTLPLGEKIAYCERLYAEAGLPPLFRITPLTPPGLDAMLEARGYERIDRTLQQVTRLNRPLLEPSTEVEFRSLPLETWLDVASPMRGQSEPARDAEYRRLRHVPLPTEHVLAYAGAEAVACGLVMQDKGHAAPADIYVVEPWRNRGLGTAISAHLLATARRDGAEYAWLNVLADNIPAVKAYARLGFETLYEYWYRVKP